MDSILEPIVCAASAQQVVVLNVGGTRYSTSLVTLRSEPDSMLGAMFSGRHKLTPQADGSYFIDRDGKLFSYIIDFLRDKNGLSLPVEDERLLSLVEREAQYFGLANLVQLIARLREERIETEKKVNPKPHAVLVEFLARLSSGDFFALASDDLTGEKKRRCYLPHIGIGVLFAHTVEEFRTEGYKLVQVTHDAHGKTMGAVFRLEKERKK